MRQDWVESALNNDGDDTDDEDQDDESSILIHVLIPVTPAESEPHWCPLEDVIFVAPSRPEGLGWSHTQPGLTQILQGLSQTLPGLSQTLQSLTQTF